MTFDPALHLTDPHVSSVASVVVVVDFVVFRRCDMSSGVFVKKNNLVPCAERAGGSVPRAARSRTCSV